MKVFVVILNLNGKDFTLDCLTSLEDLKKPKNTEVFLLVVDNGSTDNSVAAIKKNFPHVFILENRKNLGFAEGNNIGLRFALKEGADFILVLNNDTIVDKNLLTELLREVKDERVGILGPKIYFAPGYEFHKDRYQESEKGKVLWYAGGKMDWGNVLASHRGVDEVDHGQYDQVSPTDFTSGCCFLVKREILEKIGLFDARFFLYYEDNDLCQRAKKVGFKVLFVPKAHLWHLNAGTAGGSGSTLQEYYITRNRLLFGAKFAPLRAKLALFRESLKLLLFGKPWQRKGVVDFYLGRFGQGSYSLKR